MGLYLHIPFCLSKCRYCDFFSAAASREQRAEYVNALKKRIAGLASVPGMRPFTSVYFGGGTPTAIGEAGLCGLLEEVKSLGLAQNAEVSFEANPATVDFEGLAALKKAGFNRISLGAQSFVPQELELLGRIHTAAQTEETFKAARAAGFENISLDLMLGIPAQTAGSALYSVERVISLGADHVSAYCLKLEPGTPMFRAYPGGKGLPSEDAVADIYLSVVSALETAGLKQYEISNFARPGRPCRHNLLYWQLGDYIGLGPSAHSFYAGQRFEFPRGEMPGDFTSVFDGAAAEETDIEFERIMLGLRTVEGISAELLGRDAVKKLESYAKMGYARKTETGYALTPKGFLVSTHIIGEIL